MVGFFEGSAGIAASARLAVRAFEALSVPVEKVDVSEAQLDWIGKAGAAPVPGPWIFHLNAPELLAALAYLGPKRVLGPRYGYWAWELPKAPDLWLKDAALVDGVWAPSVYTAQALAGAAAPVRVVPHPLFLEDYRDVVPNRARRGVPGGQPVRFQLRRRAQEPGRRDLRLRPGLWR